MIRFRFQNYFCLIACIFLLILSIQVVAQPLGVIHIQTENNQPYEVEWAGTKYPSSAKGYLVIQQVAAGKHVLTIDFTDETGTTAAYTFSVEMADKPRGFSLRQAIDNSWSCLDMVDFTLLQGTLVIPVVKIVIPDKVTEPIQAAVKVETPVVKKEPVVVKEKTAVKPTGIQKIFDKSGSTGIDQVYVLTTGNRLDTIALFIPVIAEKNEPATGSNPAVFLDPRPFRIDSLDNVLYTRPRYPVVSLSK